MMKISFYQRFYQSIKLLPALVVALIVLCAGRANAQIILTTQNITTPQTFTQPVIIPEGSIVKITNTTVTFMQDVTIQGGANLLVNHSVVKMGTSKKIILDDDIYNGVNNPPSIAPQLYLKVYNNSRITHWNLSNFWDGIECHKSVADDWNSNPGINIQNSTIELAHCAVTNFNPQQPNQGILGGIYARDVTFKNNVRSLRLYPGLLISPLGQPDNTIGSSTIIVRCNFLLTPDFIGLNPADMVLLAHAPETNLTAPGPPGVLFQSCNFTGRDANFTTAINAINAGLWLDQAQGSASGCTFIGMKNGVVSNYNMIETPYGWRTVIANAEFKCKNAINLSGVFNPLIVNNLFTHVPDDDNVELFLRNCTGYRVEGNRLYFDGSQNYNYAGIIAMNSGVANNTIYRNLVRGGYKQALQSIGTNRSMSGQTGLKLMCNTTEEPYWDDGYGITVMTDPGANGNNGIHNTQSYIDPVTQQEKSAANKFATYYNPLPANALNYYLQPGTNTQFIYKYFNVANNTNYELPVSRNFNNAIPTINQNSCPVINTRGPQEPWETWWDLWLPTAAPPPPFQRYVSQLQDIENGITVLETMPNPDAGDTAQLEVLYDRQSRLIDSMADYYQEQGQIDSLILTYQYVTKNYHYQLMLAAAYTAKGAYNDAYQTLADIGGNYTISDEEQQQVKNLMDMGAALQWLRENRNDWANMPDVYKDMVYKCESNDAMYAGAAARALLAEHEGMEYDPVYMIPENAQAILMAKGKALNRGDKIYPNPAGNQLFIDWNQAGCRMELFDIFGRKMNNFTLLQGRNNINISALAAGVYIARIQAANKTLYQQKIVKQ